jgi:hypothetical protein
MASVKTYHEKTHTTPIPYEYFIRPVWTSFGLHVRAMTRTQKYREVNLAFLMPEKAFQSLVEGLAEDPKRGIAKKVRYDGSLGDVKPSGETTTSRLWKLKVMPGRVGAIDWFFSLELGNKKSLGLGASKLMPPMMRKGQPRLPAKRLAHALGPLRITYRLPKVHPPPRTSELPRNLRTKPAPPKATPESPS